MLFVTSDRISTSLAVVMMYEAIFCEFFTLTWVILHYSRSYVFHKVLNRAYRMLVTPKNFTEFGYREIPNKLRDPVQDLSLLLTCKFHRMLIL